MLKNKFLQAILLSQVLLQTGIWVRNFAILLFVMEKTKNDAFSVSMIYVAEFAPIFLFSLIGGTFADRWRPKRTMVWCDLLSAVSVVLVLVTFLFGSWKAIFFATLLSAILSQFSQPAALKLFKLHIPAEKLQSGMAMFQTLMAIFMVVGPVIGTFVYQKFGILTSISVMAAAFLLSALVLVFLPADRKESVQNETTVWQELVLGVRYVLASSVLKTLCGVFAIAGLAVGILQPLGVFIVVERLGLPKENLQWLLMTNGIAMLIGGGVIMGMAKKVAPQTLLAVGLLASGLSAIGIGMSNVFAITLILQFINGLFFPCIHIGINTLLLSTTEESFIGRVNGVLTPLFMGMMVLTMSQAGQLKEWFSLVRMYEVAGVLFLLGMVLLIPLIRRGSVPTSSKPQPKQQPQHDPQG